MSLMSTNGPPLTSELIDRISALEACTLCEIHIEFMHSLVMEGVFDFEADDVHSWVLNQEQFALLRRAVRLHRDLGVNAPGIALAFDLLWQLSQRPSAPR